MSQTNLTIAKTILEQLGGNRFIVMTGSKNFVGSENSLTFDLGRVPGLKIKKVRIVLTPADLYRIEFGRVRNLTWEVLETADEVYAEDLRRIFTEKTGLYTSLAG